MIIHLKVPSLVVGRVVVVVPVPSEAGALAAHQVHLAGGDHWHGRVLQEGGGEEAEEGQASQNLRAAPASVTSQAL